MIEASTHRGVLFPILIIKLYKIIKKARKEFTLQEHIKYILFYKTTLYIFIVIIGYIAMMLDIRHSILYIYKLADTQKYKYGIMLV